MYQKSRLKKDNIIRKIQFANMFTRLLSLCGPSITYLKITALNAHVQDIL